MYNVDDFTDKYWVFFDEEHQLIGQTQDKKIAKTFMRQLKKDKIVFFEEHGWLTKGETRKIRNFISLRLEDFQPFTDRIYTELDIDSLSYYVPHLIGDLSNATNLFAFIISKLKFTVEEREVVNDYLEKMDYILGDIEGYGETDEDEEPYEINISPEEYYDVDKLIKDIKSGKLLPDNYI